MDATPIFQEFGIVDFSILSDNGFFDSGHRSAALVIGTDLNITAPGENLMIKLYFHPSPNPLKVALYLEEAELPYEIIPVDIRAGAQFSPEFLALNPNAKVPAILDGSTRVFDSTAILLYLSEKTGRFLPADARDRGEMLSWLMFIATGVGPYSGQAVHFKHYAPKKLDYAVNRYEYEARRHFDILDKRLSDRPFLLSTEYTIVDMAAWGWVRVVPFMLGENVWNGMTNLKRWFDNVNARPAAVRANALKDAFTFKAEMDDDARRYMFPHLQPVVPT